MKIESRQYPAGGDLPALVHALQVEPHARMRSDHDDCMLPVVSFDNCHPLAGPVEGHWFGDRNESEISLCQPLPVEAERIAGVIRDFGDCAAENLTEAVPKIVRARHVWMLVVPLSGFGVAAQGDQAAGASRLRQASEQ